MKKAKKVSSKSKSIAIDVLNHKLVPKMRILTEKEKDHVLKKYNVLDAQLPKIYSSDPAALALGAKLGDIVEIERNDMTGKYNFYRLVID